METALADLIDNSIAASSGQVDLTLNWNNGRPIMMLSDDGTGMTEDGLVAAMRFGGFGPYVARESTDMGRFGLGLKTASLSQCRRLSVASKKDARISSFCWDLDHIRRSGDAWELLEGIPPELSDIKLGLEGRERGTVVLWDRIDFGRYANYRH